MDTRPFVEAVHELNNGFVRLLESVSALRALSGIQVRGQSERELLDNALEVLMQHQDLERCSVFLLEGRHLVNAAGLEWDEMIGVKPRAANNNSPTAPAFEVGVGLIGLAAERGELQHSDDCQTDVRFIRTLSESHPEWVEDGERLTRDAPVGSLISCPIEASGRLLGVLNVSHPHACSFGVSHERTLQVFANFLGQMMVNNRLVRRMEQQVEERTGQLEQALREAETLKRRYEELSVVDELTGLHNRRFFFPEARAALARSMRHGQSFSLLLIDVDHFKEVNDGFGHAVGDRVLYEAAECMKEQVREGDILARFGGEEFVMALPNTGSEGAAVLAERVRNTIKGFTWEEGGRSLRITLSIGISCREPCTEGDSLQLLDRLIQEADQALYMGKQNGRDQCRAFSDIACRI